ncbi:hypothetical protein OJF2_41020 [Aquisphaera giovannonii]|uniref:Uncharacterized protein n=1 Tax=Aquisphaera giovannonii TaxID=406548 RepID=A0A5B9W5Y0_9BACT|nr:hypothetical protein [Aquisphaera giovannonii]QEH35549.1 hypothetical protein OJF2_41020 [Aquisphaera giovannonii]
MGQSLNLPSPSFRPSCHRCGSPLEGSPVAACPLCVEPLGRPLGPRLRRLARWRLRGLLVLVAVAAFAAAWGVHAWHRRVADDRGQFYTHEELALYQEFQQAAALVAAREAESKAAAGDADSPRWAAEAASLRARAAALGRSAADYRWRAGIKQRLARGGW